MFISVYVLYVWGIVHYRMWVQAYLHHIDYNAIAKGIIQLAKKLSNRFTYH